MKTNSVLLIEKAVGCGDVDGEIFTDDSFSVGQVSRHVGKLASIVGWGSTREKK